MDVVSYKQWFALYTKPHKEYLVRDLLHGYGLETYLPEIRVAVPRRGRRPSKPFFPHYIFAQFSLQSGVDRVRWTPGLRRIVSSGGQPVAIPDEVVAHIRRRLATMAAEEPKEPFERGEVVRVQHGPLEGWDVLFDRRLSNEGRVRVFLQLMDRLVATELQLADLLQSSQR